jgi:hypothetical protein
MSVGNTKIDEATCRLICAFLQAQTKPITHHQWWESYPSWARGGNGWQRRLTHFGGTDIWKALGWYQHIHRPGSKEWRPAIIIKALLDAVQAQEEA